MNENRKKAMDIVIDVLEYWEGNVRWDAVIVAKDILDTLEKHKIIREEYER
jgi:hypothetical protein